MSSFDVQQVKNKFHNIIWPIESVSSNNRENQNVFISSADNAFQVGL